MQFRQRGLSLRDGKKSPVVGLYSWWSARHRRIQQGNQIPITLGCCTSLEAIPKTACWWNLPPDGALEDADEGRMQLEDEQRHILEPAGPQTATPLRDPLAAELRAADFEMIAPQPSNRLVEPRTDGLCDCS